MVTESRVKAMFNSSLVVWNIIKEEWLSHGQNFHGEWYERNAISLHQANASLNTLRQVLEYYGEEPLKID